MIPLHLTVAEIECIFLLLACVAVALTWALCVIVDEWGRNSFDYEAKGKAEDLE